MPSEKPVSAKASGVVICSPGSLPTTQSTAPPEALPRPNRFRGWQPANRVLNKVVRQTIWPVAGLTTASTAAKIRSTLSPIW